MLLERAHGQHDDGARAVERVEGRVDISSRR